MLRKSATSLLILSTVQATLFAQDTPSLGERGEQYFETAVAIVQQQPEIVDVKGRKFRVLLQDVETNKVETKHEVLRASGFFLLHDGRYLFVTARHVAERLLPSAQLGYLTPRGVSRAMVLGRLTGSAEKLDWVKHNEVDAAVLPLTLSAQGAKEVAELAVQSSDLRIDAPERTSKLIVAGYPGGLGTLGNEISPITAVVHLASGEINLGLKVEGVMIERAYLFNPPAGNGYSGAPIFFQAADSGPQCIGVLSGAWSDPTGGKFGICTPARYIIELAEQAITRSPVNAKVASDETSTSEASESSSDSDR